MAASMVNMGSSSDSSESDEEEQKRLQEAAVDCPCSTATSVRGSSFKGCHVALAKENGGSAAHHNKPSLRPKEKTHDDDQELETTPEFRNFVAKKLTSIIDSCIKIIPSSTTSVDHHPAADHDDTFRLFSTSDPRSSFESRKATAPKRAISSDSSSDSEDEKLASVAVSGDFILSQSERLISQAQEEKKTGEDIASSDRISTPEITKKKKKKKKGKHKQNEEKSDSGDIKSTSDSSNHDVLDSSKTDSANELGNSCMKKKKKKKRKKESDDQ